ncbi:hypothetical protein [Phytoactinopolyspora limicola]|uniref:hypothetical protein n=1 Tax=Phytoactinopolyspora limicola TaxID=2715536 RepID=UPI001A9C8CEE|nr:hypothetical protein [Phytoactinopolyspora limicola]
MAATRKRAARGRRMAAALAAVGLMAATLTATAPAASAAVPRLPGFTDCPSSLDGGPTNRQLWDTPSVKQFEGSRHWAAIRGSDDQRYIDKVVAYGGRYYHIRYDAFQGKTARIGCMRIDHGEDLPSHAGLFSPPPFIWVPIGGGLRTVAHTMGGIHVGVVSVGDPTPVDDDTHN